MESETPSRGAAPDGRDQRPATRGAATDARTASRSRSRPWCLIPLVTILFLLLGAVAAFKWLIHAARLQELGHWDSRYDFQIMEPHSTSSTVTPVLVEAANGMPIGGLPVLEYCRKPLNRTRKVRIRTQITIRDRTNPEHLLRYTFLGGPSGTPMSVGSGPGPVSVRDEWGEVGNDGLYALAYVHAAQSAARHALTADAQYVVHEGPGPPPVSYIEQELDDWQDASPEHDFSGVGEVEVALVEAEANELEEREQLSNTLAMPIGVVSPKQDGAGVSPIEAATEAAHVYTALQLKQAGRASDAVCVLGDVLADHPDSAAAHLAMGQTLAVLGNMSEARSHLRRVIEIAPQSDAAARARDALDGLQ